MELIASPKQKRQKLIYYFIGFCLLYSYLFFFPLGFNFNNNNYSYAVYDKDLVLVGASVAKDGQWRFAPGALPEKFEQAIITFEDKRFYYHFGIDLISIARAFIYNLKAKRIVSGGSTLTMQTVRLLEHNPKRTIPQKIHEAWYSVLLELRYTKKHILELYAANAPFGGNIVGLEAASWRYFKRSPQNLTWAEAATLAVLPNQPGLVYPGANKELLLKKRNNLLLKMYQNGIFDKDTFELSVQETIPQKAFSLPDYTPHYLEYLKKGNKKESKFYTKIDFNIQKNTSRILERWSDTFSLKGINNAAAIIIDTKTQEILAYCGNTGKNSTRNKKNYSVDLIQSPRSSGSLLKPFLYSAMIDSGLVLNEQIVSDIPIRIGNYKPQNNVPIYRGVVPAEEALTRSLNIPAVLALKEYRISAFLHFLKQCGFSTFNRKADYYGLPLILGGGEITLYEATKAYASMMQKASGEKSNYPVSQGAAWLTLEALQKGIRPDDEALWQSFANSKKIAWKTGTSSGNRDAWAIGTTEEYTIGVWIGNAQGEGNKELTSVSTSAPVMFDLFSSLPETTWPDIPFTDLKEVEICVHSGYLASHNCQSTKIALKPKKAPYTKLCPYCTTVSLTPDYTWQASVEDMHGKYENQMPINENWFVLPPLLEYYYCKHSVDYKKLPAYIPGHQKASPQDLSIIFPLPQALIIIPTNIDGKKESVVLEAATRQKETELYWDLDGTYLGSTKTIHQMAVSPSYGKHVLTVTDSNGTQKVRTFEIIESE